MKPVCGGSWYLSDSILDVIKEWQDQMDVLEILILQYPKWIWGAQTVQGICLETILTFQAWRLKALEENDTAV